MKSDASSLEETKIDSDCCSAHDCLDCTKRGTWDHTVGHRRRLTGSGAYSSR